MNTTNNNHDGDPEVNRIMGQMMAGLRKQDDNEHAIDPGMAATMDRAAQEIRQMHDQEIAGLHGTHTDAREGAADAGGNDVIFRNHAADMKAALQESAGVLDNAAATLQQIETLFKMIGREAEGSRDIVVIANLAEIGQRLGNVQRDAVEDAHGFASTVLSDETTAA